jgi:hypothetical protein
LTHDIPGPDGLQVALTRLNMLGFGERRVASNRL